MANYEKCQIKIFNYISISHECRHAAVQTRLVLSCFCFFPPPPFFFGGGGVVVVGEHNTPLQIIN